VVSYKRNNHCCIKVETDGCHRVQPLSKDAKDVSSDEMKVLDEEMLAMKDEHSSGVDRMFEFGPTCTFNGSQVPTFITCSKNSSITSQLLTNLLSKMDELELFHKSSGVNPSSYAMGMGVDLRSLSSNII
jgi:hypothetical protein